MLVQRSLRAGLLGCLMLTIAGCGYGSRQSALEQRENLATLTPSTSLGTGDNQDIEAQRSSVFDIIGRQDNPNTTVEVNKYIWQASLEVLNFLPVESVDPFSGVISTGYGTPPGGGRAYRATIYVQDPALDARSLKVALQSRNGAVPNETVRAVEDAILTRARQLRIRDSKL